MASMALAQHIGCYSFVEDIAKLIDPIASWTNPCPCDTILLCRLHETSPLTAAISKPALNTYCSSVHSRLSMWGDSSQPNCPGDVISKQPGTLPPDHAIGNLAHVRCGGGATRGTVRGPCTPHPRLLHSLDPAFCMQTYKPTNRQPLQEQTHDTSILDFPSHSTGEGAPVCHGKDTRKVTRPECRTRRWSWKQCLGKQRRLWCRSIPASIWCLAAAPRTGGCRSASTG